MSERQFTLDASALGGGAPKPTRWADCETLWEEEGGVPKPLLQLGVTPAMWQRWHGRHKLRSEAANCLNSMQDEGSVWKKIASRILARSSPELANDSPVVGKGNRAALPEEEARSAGAAGGDGVPRPQQRSTTEEDAVLEDAAHLPGEPIVQRQLPTPITPPKDYALLRTPSADVNRHGCSIKYISKLRSDMLLASLSMDQLERTDAAPPQDSKLLSSLASSAAPNAQLRTLSVQLLVSPLRGPTFPLLVRRDAPAATLTAQLAERCGLPASAFRLLFRGRYVVGELEGGQLQRDELVRMVLRAPLRGGMLTRPVERSGYLVKEPMNPHAFSRPRRRFFRLSERKLEWFADDKPTRQPKGSMQLAGARIERSADALVIVLAGERLVLRGDALDEWAAAIREQADESSAPTSTLAASAEIKAVNEQADAEVRAADERAGAAVERAVTAIREHLEESSAPTSKLAAASSATTSAASAVAMTEEMRGVLAAFDNNLIEALRGAIIRLVCVAWLLAQPDDLKMPYRQQLEELERSGASPSPLLSPEEAVALILQGDRSVGAVTHGWLSPGNPDPAGSRMKLLRQELKSLPNIKGIFFECAHRSTRTQRVC